MINTLIVKYEYDQCVVQYHGKYIHARLFHTENALIKLFRAVLWNLFHLTSTSLNSNLTSHTTDHTQELNSVRFAARYWCIPVLPGARFSRWIGYCYTHCYNVAAACFSCPRGKATTITRYLTPGMRIIPGEPRQKTCILPIFKQGRVLLWQPGTPVYSDLVAAGHQLVPGRSAQRLDVVVLQPNPALGQVVQMRSPDLRAVVAHIIPAEIIRQNQHDIRRFGRDTWDRNEKKTQRELPHSHSELESDAEESLTDTRLIWTIPVTHWNKTEVRTGINSSVSAH